MVDHGGGDVYENTSVITEAYLEPIEILVSEKIASLLLTLLTGISMNCLFLGLIK